MKKILLILCIFASITTHAQFTDNFSDGDFTQNPSWTGDVNEFNINSDFQLQLNSTGTNISHLSSSVQISDDIEWNFWIKLSFAPSDNNNARVYLISDQADLEQNLNGYYLKFGETGSNDAIELIKQTGSQHTVLCRSNDGIVSAAFTARVKVTHSQDGDWAIYTDMSGGQNYVLQAETNETAQLAGSFIGVYCKYTTTNSTRFYFDDFYMGAIQHDTEPPQVTNIAVISQNAVEVNFSEPINSASLSNLSNYFLKPNNINAYTVNIENPQKIILAFDINFISDLIYTLEIKNLEDMSGNILLISEHTFAIHNNSSFDILINEIMADPTPVIGLPDAEYLELYNRSDYPVNLEGWSISINKIIKPLPNYTLEPKAYVILCDDGSVPALESYGNIIDFSSFSLTNSGSEITLYDNLNNVIHTVKYTDNWYKDDYKKDGGWSLELIDPLNPCAGTENWAAAINTLGGTPGSENSVNGINADTTLPKILRVGVIDNYTIEVWFTETCDSIQLANPLNYTIDNQIGNPASVINFAPTYNKVHLQLLNPISNGTLYTLVCNQNISDCVGNLFNINFSAKFAIPSEASSNDIIINEVLFNPYASSVDWIEIWNISNKVIDLKDLVLANYDTTTNTMIGFNEISSTPFLIMPQEYYVISTDQEAIKSFYSTPNPQNFIDVVKIPTMSNDFGSVAICKKNGEFINKMFYTSDMHFSLLKDVKGVSLELINPNVSSLQSNNWQSSAETNGFATPAYKNSQFSTIPESTAELILDNEVFSPDNDGYKDVLGITLNKVQPGSMINIRIFDTYGQLVRTLAQNQSSSTTSTIYWDGLKDNRTKVSIGRYVIFVETYDLDGNLYKTKKSVVVAGNL